MEREWNQRAMRNEWINRNRNKELIYLPQFQWHWLLTRGYCVVPSIMSQTTSSLSMVGRIRCATRRGWKKNGRQNSNIRYGRFLKTVMPHRGLQNFWTRTNHFLYSAALLVNLERRYNPHILSNCNGWGLLHIHLLFIFHMQRVNAFFFIPFLRKNKSSCWMQPESTRDVSDSPWENWLMGTVHKVHRGREISACIAGWLLLWNGLQKQLQFKIEVSRHWK